LKVVPKELGEDPNWGWRKKLRTRGQGKKESSKRRETEVRGRKAKKKKTSRRGGGDRGENPNNVSVGANNWAKKKAHGLKIKNVAPEGRRDSSMILLGYRG